MQVETRLPEEIHRSLDGTRQHIDDDLDELGRRMRRRSESVPQWVKGASVAAAVFLVRKPLFGLLKTTAALAVPVVVPILIGRPLERREKTDCGGGASFPG